MAMAVRLAGSAIDDREPQIQVGIAPLDKAREAAWMTLLAAEVDSGVQLQGQVVALPLGMQRTWSETEYGEVGEDFEGAASGVWDHAWRHHTSQGVVSRGELVGMSRPGDRYALQLLGVAEAGVVQGLPVRCLSKRWLVPPAATAARAFYDRGEFAAIHRELRARAAAVCSAG
jgi:hypothetical protein